MFGWIDNLQIVGYRQYAGYTLGLYLGERFVRRVVNDALQRNVSIFDSDVNWKPLERTAVRITH